MVCIDCRNIETLVKNAFQRNFIQKKEIGIEYFEGNYVDMIDIIYTIIKNEYYNKVSKLIEVEESKEESREEIDEEDNKIISCGEWMSDNKIDKVIITNKKGEGYLRFKGQLWRKLYDRNKFGFDENSMEDLQGFIENSPYMYNIENIKKDIISKCYTNKIEHYRLNYNEYVFAIKSNTSVCQYILFNSLSFTFESVDNIIQDKILTSENSGGRVIHIKNNIDISIVDNILSSLVKPDIICKYKKLLYNLIVKQEEEIIFYDYNECILTTMMIDILYSISGHNYYIDNEDLSFNELNQILKTSKPRCIIVNNRTNVNYYLKLGFKNIIVRGRDNKMLIYNNANYKKYIDDNKESIIEKLNSEYSKYDITNWDRDTSMVTDLFYKSDLLLTNFLKWICSSHTDFANMHQNYANIIEKWLIDFIIKHSSEEVIELTGKEVFDFFNKWLCSCNIEYAVTIQAFFLRLKNLNISGICEGRKTNKGNTINYNIKLLKSHFKLQ